MSISTNEDADDTWSLEPFVLTYFQPSVAPSLLAISTISSDLSGGAEARPYGHR